MLLTLLISVFTMGKGDLNPTLSSIKKDSTAKRVWVYGADFKLNFSLANSSPNWTGGSSNNITITGLINAGANLTRNGMSWDNSLKINIGLVSNRQNDALGQSFLSSRKNIDNLFLDSKLGMEFNQYPTLSFYGGLNFQTQLLPGYTYTKDAVGREVAKLSTSFLSQGQTQFALGTENKFHKNYFIRLGYVTLKQTYVINQKIYTARNEEVIARVKRGQYIDNEFGIQLQMGGTKLFGPNQIYQAKLNYLGFLPYKTDAFIMDSRIDLGITAKLSKYFNVNYTLISIFDKDLVKPQTNAWQNSWVFGIGYSYNI